MKMIFNEYERNMIREYNGKWGWKMPDNVPFIIIEYNMLCIWKEIKRIVVHALKSTDKFLKCLG